MKNETVHISEEQWKAIMNNDVSYDDVFIYAVVSTGIFCRPSCKSRIPNRENVRIFKDGQQAMSESFRPCKRCKPEGVQVPDREWVIQIVQYIDQHYSQSLSLEILADMCHGSPYHIQRTFKNIMGITPVEYIQTLRIAKAKELLVTSGQSVGEIGLLVGLANTPYFITLFKKKTGITPKQYRKSMIEVSGDGTN